MCGEKIISILHNNKASIKVFECLTGLKLPKSYKKRIEYLRGISVSDFKDARTYKPEAVKENEEMFYISMFSGDWDGVRAERFKKYGFDIFISEIGGVWNLSEAKNVLNISMGESKEICRQNILVLNTKKYTCYKTASKYMSVSTSKGDVSGLNSEINQTKSAIEQNEIRVRSFKETISLINNFSWQGGGV